MSDRIPELPTDRHFLDLSETCLIVYFSLVPRKKIQHGFNTKVNKKCLITNTTLWESKTIYKSYMLFGRYNQMDSLISNCSWQSGIFPCKWLMVLNPILFILLIFRRPTRGYYLRLNFDIFVRNFMYTQILFLVSNFY